LHFAVAFAGVPAGAGVTCAFPDVAGAAACPDAGGAGVGVGGFFGVAVGVAETGGTPLVWAVSANHVFTPPCCEQAPVFVAAFV
jgi:hypothetical protein